MADHGRGKQSTTHHPGKKTDISMGLILIPFRRIDLDHLKPALLPVPVENALHARPPTPLHAPPARPRAAHPDLRHPRDIDVRPIDARIPPPRAPRLLRLDDNRATSGPARALQHPACPPLPSHPTLSTAAAQRLPLRHSPIFRPPRPPTIIAERAVLLPPGGLALRRRRRRGRPLAHAGGRGRRCSRGAPHKRRGAPRL